MKHIEFNDDANAESTEVVDAYDYIMKTSVSEKLMPKDRDPSEPKGWVGEELKKLSVECHGRGLHPLDRSIILSRPFLNNRSR